MSGKKSDPKNDDSIKLSLDDLVLSTEESADSATSPQGAKKNAPVVPTSEGTDALGFDLVDVLEDADRTFADTKSQISQSLLSANSDQGDFSKEPSLEGPPDLSEQSVATVVGQMADAEEMLARIKAETAQSKNNEHPLDEIPVPQMSDDDVRTVVGKITGTLSGIPTPFKKSVTQSSVQAEPSQNEISTPSEFDNFDITKLHSTDKDFETLRKYASIKEREAREKEVIAEVLRKQIIQMKNKNDSSDRERRRVTLELEELKATLGSLKDSKDQFDMKLRKIEQAYQEQIKSLSAQIDSHQFAAQRAERKLSEFRDRVRQDLMKIRSRERELANKLDLQKRDAEALLQAKDERLLSQRREIDRLEFEMQSLKERMIDETSKAEERAGKLTRALQSLKMAQGVLSGIDEEVLPGAGSKSSKKSDAA